MTNRFERRLALTAFAIALTFAGVPGAKAAEGVTDHTADKDAIAAAMSQYEAALNGSNTEAAMALYAEDGVFMPPYSRSAVGKPAVRAAYDAVFKAITLHVTFHIAELVEMSSKWAFVRTNSAGTNTINSTGAQSAEANQELFIFRKDNGKWKIARYSFSTTNPEPH